MLSREEIEELAKKLGKKPWIMEKHYVQSAILTAISRYQLVFKGGTYLWFFHGLRRFSEDLDFSAIGKVNNEIAEEVSDFLALLGFENSVKIIKDDSFVFSFRLSVEDPLNTSEKDLCHVYVEISKRKDVVLEPLRLKLDIPYYDLPPKILLGMKLEEVLAEKVRAIIRREKARDVFDLYFLLKKVDIDLDLINKKLSIYGEKFDVEDFIERVKEKRKVWRSELEPLVETELPDFDKVLSEISKRFHQLKR